MTGKLQGNKAVFAAAIGKRRYLGGRANEFSATSQYPPKGQKEGKAVIENGKLTGSYGKKTFELERLERKSPSLGAKAPKGAIVLFDGTGKGEWQGGRLDEQTKLLNTDGRDIRTARKFQNYTMHVEFLLPSSPPRADRAGATAAFIRWTITRSRSSIRLGWKGKITSAVASTPRPIRS